MAQTPRSLALYPVAQIWTGAALLTLATGTPQAWDPPTNSWQPLAPAPHVIGFDPGDVAVVWTGRALLVWGELSTPGTHGNTTGVPSGIQLGPP
jgi:hypothetical protein